MRVSGLHAGSRWNSSSYRWSKSSDDCLKELKCLWHDIFQNRNTIAFFYISFSIIQSLDLYILSTFDLYFINHHLLTVIVIQEFFSMKYNSLYI